MVEPEEGILNFLSFAGVIKSGGTSSFFGLLSITDESKSDSFSKKGIDEQPAIAKINITKKIILQIKKLKLEKKKENI
tara:strand:- start:69 stop:302 length:234 start_codon:yes stop_codon:yes gene_type:complete